jgi:hypothetical protein
MHEEELAGQQRKVYRRVLEAFIVGIIVLVGSFLVHDQRTVYVVAWTGVSFLALIVTLFRGLSAAVYWNRMEKIVWEEA